LTIAWQFPEDTRAKIFSSVIALVIKFNRDRTALDQALSYLDNLPIETNISGFQYSNIFSGMMATVIKFEQYENVWKAAWTEAATRFQDAECKVLSGIMAIAIKVRNDQNLTDILRKIDSELEQFPEEIKADVFYYAMEVLIETDGQFGILSDVLPIALEIYPEWKDGTAIRRIIRGLVKRPEIEDVLRTNLATIRSIADLDAFVARGLIDALVMGKDPEDWVILLNDQLERLGQR
jgi:hypothetical protein